MRRLVITAVHQEPRCGGVAQSHCSGLRLNRPNKLHFQKTQRLLATQSGCVVRILKGKMSHGSCLSLRVAVTAAGSVFRDLRLSWQGSRRSLVWERPAVYSRQDEGEKGIAVSADVNGLATRASLVLGD